MYIKDLRLWSKDKNLKNLLFFVSKVRELTFDYSLDSFKYPMLNACSICYEGIELIEEIEQGNFNEKSIIPVLEELKFKFNEDNVAKYIIGEYLEHYLNFGDFSNLKEIKTKLQLLSQKLHPLKYDEAITKQLKDIIVNNTNENLKLSSLTNLYVTNLINIGFSQSFIYKNIKTIFFSNTKIIDFEPLNELFENLRYEVQTYQVVFKCSKLLNELVHSSKAFNSLIVDQIPEDLIEFDKQQFYSSLSENQTFYICQNIKALDPVSAKEIAEKRINKISNLFCFYHHKENPKWDENTLVINLSSKYSFLIKERISSMSKGRDLKPKKAGNKLNRLINNLQLDENSFAKYDRAIDLHAISLQNKNVENQLLQNWIAFETLLVGYSKESKIDQVLHHLIDFLTYKYTESIIEEISRDLYKFNSKVFPKLIESIKIGSNYLEKLSSLIVLDELKTERHNLYNLLENNPLLKFKIYNYHKKFSKIKSIEELYKRHKKLVEWQIKRMYRARNLIVHAGVVPPYSEILVEHSHTYLDKLLNTINNLSIEQKINSIEQAIKEIEILEYSFFRYLSMNRDKQINIDNYKKLLLFK